MKHTLYGLVLADNARGRSIYFLPACIKRVGITGVNTKKSLRPFFLPATDLETLPRSEALSLPPPNSRCCQVQRSYSPFSRKPTTTGWLSSSPRVHQSELFTQSSNFLFGDEKSVLKSRNRFSYRFCIRCHCLLCVDRFVLPSVSPLVGTFFNLFARHRLRRCRRHRFDGRQASRDEKVNKMTSNSLRFLS